jgi:predicted site-specific integrase-resolvase
MRETLGVHEFARLSGRHFNTVYNWIRSGSVAARKQDGEWRIPTSELDRVRQRRPDLRAGSEDLLDWWSRDFEQTMRRLVRLSTWMERLGKQALSRHGASMTHIVAEARSDELSDMVTELRDVATAIETAERLRPRLLELRSRG